MKKTSFFNLDKKIYAVLLFLWVLIADFLAAVLGFGGAQFVFIFSEGISMSYSFESLLFSVLAIYLNFLIIIYSYRNNQPNKLKALGCANLIMSLVPFIFNAIYHPFAYLLVEAVTKLTKLSDTFRFSDFRFFLAEFISLPMSICCFILLFRLKKNKEIRANIHISFYKFSLISMAVFVSLSASCWYICNSPVSEYFNYSGFADLAEHIATPFKSKQTAKFYDRINNDTDFSQIDKQLKKEGFFPHTEIDKYVNNKDELDICLYDLEYILSGNGEIVYTKPVDGYISYDNSCIVLFPDEDGKVKCKKYIDAYNNYNGKNDTEKSKELFETFEINADKKTVLKKMKKVADVVSFSVEYKNNAVKEIYTFNAFNYSSSLHSVDTVNFNAVIIFENDILTGGNYIYTTESNYESDDVVCETVEYEIK